MSSCKFATQCRLCDSKSLNQVLHLTPTPPANEFVPEPVEQKEYPLDLLECQECGHVQLSYVVDPEILFKNYLYVSGTSPSFVKHFEDYSDHIINKLSIKEDSFVIDIGSNDGTLLKAFDKRDMYTLGVDPAIEISEQARRDGIATITGFFDKETALDIEMGWGKADLITANNIFAHTDDLREFASLVKNLLKPNGCFVFEVSYLGDVLDKTLFDSIYSEHVSYHHLNPLVKFFKSLEMSVVDVERIDTHGGSLRVYVVNGSIKPKDSVALLLAEEKSIHEKLLNYAPKIEKIKTDLVSRLAELKEAGKTIAGFGAPAKFATLAYHFGLDKNTIDFICDDNPLKQGLLAPGKHIPVLPSSALYERKPDVVVIFAWNFAESIIKNHQEYLEQGGHFIVPIPELKEYKNAIS